MERKSKTFKFNNKLTVNDGKYPIICDGCSHAILKNETYLNQTLIGKGNDDIELAYCDSCTRELLSSEEFNTLFDTQNSPNELCDKCIEFLNSSHYDNDKIKPLYDMLNKLKELLK